MERYAVLDDNDRALLSRITSIVRSTETGTDLSRESDGTDRVCIVMEGFACRYRLKADGGRQITDYFVPGDLFDLATVGTTQDVVSVLVNSKVARVPQETIVSAMEKSSAIETALNVAALVTAATLREWLMNIGRRSAEERLAHLFCELFTRMEAVGLVHESSFKLPLTQFDLGDAMGLSYVHVNRTIQSLRQRSLFTLKSRTLTILDLPGLQKLAGFDAAYLG